MPDNPEFSFHVHKLMDNSRRPALFTVAVWEGTVRSICHAHPLDAALVVIRHVLDECGGQATGEEAGRHSASK